MPQGWETMPSVQWIISNETVLWWLAAASIATFVATLILVPWLLARVPADYFTRAGRQKRAATVHHPVIRVVVTIGRNLLGMVFILAGILMLVLPGQGILTILAGITLVDFPGKHRLEGWIVSRKVVLQSINWLRRRQGHPPLVTDE